MVAQNLTSISAGGRKQDAKKDTVQKKPQKKIWVVKLQRIPFGFFEKELLGYFRQFGNVLRIRVARSRKTGNHKGWAYVGFDNKAVAEIAAESMNGYLMFEQRLRCKVMKPAVIPKSMLKGPLLVMRPSFMGLAKKDAIARNRCTTKNDAENTKRRMSNLKKTILKIQNLGIDYDFSMNGVKNTPSKKVVDNDVQLIGTAKAVTPKQATPKTVTPPTPKVSTPKAAKPETPKAATPVTTKKVVIKTPQTEKVKATEKPAFSPKTRAAKAAALGTPQAKSTLSKTIMKSVAASARPAVVEKKTVRGRGKKKSL